MRRRWTRRVALGVVAISGAFVSCDRPAEPPPEVVEVAPEPEPEPPPVSPEAPEVALYFPGADGALHVERPRLELPDAAGDRLASLVRSLIAGPEGEELVSPLPPEVTVGSVLVGDGGLAYVDLRMPDGAAPPQSGSQTELLTVYSLVNTLVVNTDGVEAVVLLWNGTQRASLSGHVDTGRPLTPSNRWLADES